ncbi:carbohydrate ABC transporter substrate-binding protein [Rhizobium rhizogenes]|jgi:alpha-glucoside transport system substrate-binding protein|uniref:Alpha-glucoside ABC transporter substrate-binding protein n=2 Tax=Rhizobium/Agrobacterium group TaxID=227290 RepID=A0AB36EL61_AGRTU|nr:MULTISPECIES: ABC transporter substrate-binding protein [Rhizobium/Agrobacterium group]AHK00453.1 alpha-glucosides-binding periplasmic protein AglE precursor [Agrobacterium tumefaciens LBA4213 (Ach5)]AKC06295.1 ABC transporter, substrate binding protein (alpha-glucoside) [Agrobacterium tumefaciens]AYM09845.1 alpha-glucoside transport system substrate-binding protein [Agrobacterium tumefaciens]AYM15199.1 alpha-glucoside transport system substrate-binding protein [Agrobacterium tumefaciens]AY
MQKTFLATAASIVLLSGSAFAADLKFAPGQDAKFNWKSYEDFKAAHADLKGQTLTIFGPWRGEDEALFQTVLAYFSDATGVNVRYSSSENYEQQIVIDTQAGSPPNIAILPQPGLLADLAAKGFLVPLGDETASWVKDNYGAGQSWVDLGSYKGKDGNKAYFAFPFKADVKSLVWYVPENFEEAGYKVPESMEDLFKLTDQIVADGGTPWCIGLGSGGATGWPATDWVEDLMLRTQPLDVYQKWTTNEVKFTDPAVVAAINEFGKFAKNEKYVSGGVAAVASTDFRDSPKGLFDIPPKCYLHHQASFVPSFFPDGTKVGTDVDFFYMPTYAAKPELGKPVLGAGTLVTITKEAPAAKAFVDFLKTPIAHEVWMAQSSFLTPYKGVNVDTYANEQMKRQGEILTSATTFGFDGSDLMPGKIGAGAFWTGMIDFVGGKSADQVAADIQKAWDGLK